MPVRARLKILGRHKLSLMLWADLACLPRKNNHTLASVWTPTSPNLRTRVRHIPMVAAYTSGARVATGLFPRRCRIQR